MSSRLRAAALFLLVAVAVLSVLPNIDLPETAFDETDTQISQAAVTTEADLSQCISLEAAFAPILFARTRTAWVRSIPPANESHQFRESLSTIRC